MKRFKAVFLDRDGTISQKNQALYQERDRYIGELIGVENFQLTNELFFKFFDKVGKEYISPDDITTLEKEELFWKKWYQLILNAYGISDKSAELADQLYERYAFHKMKEPYPETVELLDYLKKNGYKIGVISDTFPSLEKSLEAMGIADYFDSFICSSEIGVMKPDPKIYNEALESLGVGAEESIFVDDYDVEADGARKLGFTSFHLDRECSEPDIDNWTITNLSDLIDFLEMILKRV